MLKLCCDVVDPAFRELIYTNEPAEVITEGLTDIFFTEGPVWSYQYGCLFFSDIPGNKMYRYNPEIGVRKFLDHTFKANGNAIDRRNRLLSCEHATSRIVSREFDGSGYRILCSHYEGREFNSPNDIVVKSDGSIWFTDPAFGRTSDWVGVERSRQLEFQGVFKLAGGALSAVIIDFNAPNGLCFSPDEKYLYVNDSLRYHIRRFKVEDDGTVTDGVVFTVTEGDGPGRPDGMKVDCDGNVYLCAQGGIHVFTPGGRFLGRVVIPEQTGNLCFGGKDGKDIFVCASDKVYRIRGKRRGFKINK